ncbi:unnamed protein product, partial [marine sediment metagenome]
MQIIAQAKGRVIVSSFASLINRIQQVVDAAKLSKEAIAKLKKERGGILPAKYQAGTGGLMLKDSYAILSYLNDPLGKRYQTNRSLFIGLLNMRNRSI